MCVKKLACLLLLPFCLPPVFSQDLPETFLREGPPASREIMGIADEMLSIADKWDGLENYLNRLTGDLEASRTDSAELKLTLDRMRETYAGLRSDYGTLQLRSKKWKTLSIAFGVTSAIFAMTTLLALSTN